MKTMLRLIGGLLIALSCSAACAQDGGLSYWITMLHTYEPLKLSSRKVLASQFATAAKGMISGEVAVAQGGMAAKMQLSTTTELLKSFQRYGVYSGQGAQTCMAVNQGEDIDAANARTLAAINAFVGTEGDGRAKYAPSEYERSRSAVHMERYCSAQEHNMGLCVSKFDGMAKFGTDYSKFARTDHLTSKQAKAAGDFVATLVAPAMPKVVSTQCDTACMEDRSRNMRLSALSSMASMPFASQMANRSGVKTYLKEFK